MSEFDNRTQILHELINGGFHSGEMLGDKLGISRAAVAKHVKALQTLGLDIFSVTGKGYKLNYELNLLSSTSLKELMNASHKGNIEVLNVIDSTNTYLKGKIAELENGEVCLAEAQTAGRGRQGRTWVSPFGASLYLSMFWRFESGFQALSGLSLVIGVATVNALEKIGVSGLSLKWPNDVYLHGTKLAGILIEAESMPDNSCGAVIGVGINIQLPEDIKEIDQPFTDIASHTNESIDRNRIAAEVIGAYREVLAQFTAEGLLPFKSRWMELDHFSGAEIAVSTGEQKVLGINQGIDDSGALLLEIKDSSGTEIKRFFGGEVSVRGQ
ncbi:MAG: bifunctional biotin--[acetyl-CoA-carboxylase] ligase/biotin operon repressor BirA [Alteromonadaceae bacterium]|nr:bifunctional biotin--[acetyl-CoA-carboxylase] ligase/biotin operon repressor BirA [Alteromonadaceae bacterium]